MSKTSEHRNRYRNNVARWRAQYNTTQSTLKVADLSEVQLFVHKNCEKKGCKRKSDHRHHKGHEYLFATLDEETYAKRYIEFRSEDIVYLCKKCHKSIHRLYRKIIDDLFNILKHFEDRSNKEEGIVLNIPFWGDPEIGYSKKEIQEHFRLKLVKKCEDWLNRSLPKKRKKRRK